jgi:seryl-tRNA synthetase
VRRALEARASGAPIDVLLEQDANRLRVLRDVEELKARRNRLSQDVAVAKRQRQDATAMVEESRALGGRISEREAELRALDEALARTALQFPNLPHPSVPLGADAEANVELRRWGTPREFGFPVRPHWELGEAWGSWTSSAAPSSPRRASRCSGGSARGSSEPSPSSCWISTRSSTATRKCGFRTS